MNILTDADYEFHLLGDATGVVDGRLAELNLEFRRSSDPDSDGILDRLEYISGFGFVACQAYITAHIGYTKTPKRRALEVGPIHRCGASFVALVNAAANHWKHEPEWPFLVPIESFREVTLRPEALRTLEILEQLGVSVGPGHYPVANVLCELTKPRLPRFANILPFLQRWRDGLHSE